MPSLNDKLFDKVDKFLSKFEWWQNYKIQVEAFVANYLNELQEKKKKKEEKEKNNDI